jgi:serine/threonine protein kinase
MVLKLSFVFWQCGLTLSGAPETYETRRGTKIAVPRSVDIWSLGCVFSLAATWVTLGLDGVRTYEFNRKKAIAALVEQQHSPNNRNLAPTVKAQPVLACGDYFHNGRTVLPEVWEWHSYLRNIMRRTDHISDKVLDIVESSMLLEESGERVEAKKLRTKLEDLSGPNSGENISNKLRETLVALEEDSSRTVATRSRIQSSVNHLNQYLLQKDVTETRRERKERWLQIPQLKVSNRTVTLSRKIGGEKLSGSNQPAEQQTEAQTEILTTGSGPDLKTPTTSKDKLPIQLNQQTLSMPSREMSSILLGKTVTENVIQAHESFLRAQDSISPGRAVFRKVFGGSKDQTLSEYYKDRDIVCPNSRLTIAL